MSNEVKKNKTYCTLYIYAKLHDEGSITKDEIKKELGLTDLRFMRYLQEIRAYLCNFSTAKELVYNRREDRYYIQDI
jgi:hypothetical protein